MQEAHSRNYRGNFDNANKIANNNSAYRVMGRYNPADENLFLQNDVHTDNNRNKVRTYVQGNDANIYKKGISMAGSTDGDE